MVSGVSGVSEVAVDEFRGDFGLRLDFNRNSRNPSRIFLVLADLITALEATDRTLMGSINADIEPIFLLEDVEDGSVLVWLKTILESIDDEGLKELDIKKVVGGYLVKAKYVIIDFINKRTSIRTAEEVIELQATLAEIADETKDNQLDIYRPPNLGELLEDIGRIQEPLARLEPGETIYYLTPSSAVPFNPSFSISPDEIEDLATSRTLDATMPMILKIKTVEYLGQAQWTFRHEKKPIKARIMDTEWLRRFKDRKVPLMPGDALDAMVQVITKYDFNNEVISTQYIVVKVNGVLPGTSADQRELEIEAEEIDSEESD